MSSTVEKIVNNARREYPNGRAWYLPGVTEVGEAYITEDGTLDYEDESGEGYISSGTVVGGVYHRLHEAFAETEAEAYDDALSIMDALLPDNDNFTMDDAIAWYRRLGIYNSGLVTLLQMKAAIAQKYYGRSENRYRQNYLYIQGQLQLAGFDVYLYENRFDDGMGGYITKTVSEIMSALYPRAYYGMTGYGQVGYAYVGVPPITKCVNYIEESKDAPFGIGANWRSTFFVAGNTIDSFADVPESRKTEFRQLLISLKPCQEVGLLFINYTV